MTLFQSCASARMRARSKGLRVLFGLASLLLLEGCRTWDGGGWHGYRHHRHHDHDSHHRRPAQHPPPAPIVVPKFKPPAPLPHLPAQPAYRPQQQQHHWHHRQRSGEPSRRRYGGHEHRKRR